MLSASWGRQEGVFRALEVRRIEHQDRWVKEAINNVIGVPCIANGKWTGDKPVTQIDPFPPPQCRLRELEYTGRESPEQTLRPSVPLQDARVAMRSDLESEHKFTQTPCRARIEECLKTTPEGAERQDRRSEVLNEALAKEVERDVRRREDIGSTAGELAVPQELKDMPIPPDSAENEVQ